VYIDVTPRGIDAYVINYQAKRKETVQTKPFVLPARGAINYFEVHNIFLPKIIKCKIEEEFNILSMAKSGYGLMIGMMILMMFCAKNMPSMGKFL